MIRIMTVFGTRPEAIKLGPIVKALQAEPGVELTVCTTGQHREMLKQVLDLFEIEPDTDLALMTPGQTLTDITGRVLDKLTPMLAEQPVDWLLVQGDTTTAFAAGLAAFYQKIPVAHVEAGLRSGDNYQPFPEEVNRKMVSSFAALHFAPTEETRDNLLKEGIASEAIKVTGNSVIDALLYFQGRLENDQALAEGFEQKFDFLDPTKRLVLVTGHRRENFEGGIDRMCQALVDIAGRGDVQIVYPVHPNPKVRGPVGQILANQDGIHLLDPLDYLPFVYMMTKAEIILTDSGGIQEEAPALGKPVMVTRETTERPEGVTAGTAKLVGTDRDLIVTEVSRLLDDQDSYQAMSRAHNPYGDGKTSARIVKALGGTPPAR
ncbi:MAG: non-hydrolyzing UDP-N-acetylglucosamine 2-epimerase [Geminicoccaceae bacterium]